MYQNRRKQNSSNIVQLFEYMITKDVSQSSLAKRIGISQPTLSRYVSGDVLPNVVTALKIQQITSGEVPVEAWLTVKQDVAIAVSRQEQLGRDGAVVDYG